MPADEIMTTTELSAIVPEYWSTSWYDVLLNAIVFQDCISQDYQGEIANLGDTVNVTQFPEFDDAYEFAENEAVPADGVSPTQIQLVVNKRVAKDFIITNTAQIQGLDAQTKLRDLAFYAIIKKMQAVIVEAIVPSASSPDHQIAYDSGTTLALADFLEIKELLDTANVPEGNRFSVHGAAQWNDFWNITGFTSRDYISQGDMMSGASLPGLLLGFKPKMTNVVGSTSYFMHRSFLQMAVQKNPVPKVYDKGVQGVRAERVNLDVLFGVKLFDSKRCATLS